MLRRVLSTMVVKQIFRFLLVEIEDSEYQLGPQVAIECIWS